MNPHPLVRLTAITLLAVVAALGLLAVFAAPEATTYYVSPSGDDSNSCDSPSEPCETIGAALAKASSGDSLQVADGTYEENLTVDKNIAILGQSESETVVDGGGSARVFVINAGVVVTMSNLTVRNGFTSGVGGGISSDGVLTLENVTVRDSGASNTGGGIGIGLFAPGRLTLKNSTVISNAAGNGAGIGGYGPESVVDVSNSLIVRNIASSNGGGIGGAIGVLSVTGSIITGNRAAYGGGISALYHLHMVASTIAGNSAGQFGGGISIGTTSIPATVTPTMAIISSTLSGNVANRSAGGLVLAGVRTVGVVINSTFSGNHVTDTTGTIGEGGGIANLAASGRLRLFNVTVANNSATGAGGGLYTLGGGDAETRVWNSIIAANTFQEGAGDCGGPLISRDYNLLGALGSPERGGCTISGPTEHTLTGANPRLEPLGDNGGPTQTHALAPGSPAIDAGNPDGCVDPDGFPLTADQRGRPRPDGPACDIGAFEGGEPRPPGTLFLPIVLRP